MDARHTNEANEPPRKAAARFPVDSMRSLPRRSPLFVRLGLTAMLASVIGVASCVTGAALGMGEFGAMLLGLVAGGFGGLLGGARSVRIRRSRNVARHRDGRAPNPRALEHQA